MPQINIAAAPTLVIAAGNAAGRWFFNESDSTIYLAFDGDAAVTAATGFPLAPGERALHEREIYTSRPINAQAAAIYAIHAAVGNKVLRHGLI